MKLLRKLLKGVSLTAAMFVFQACYGTEPDYCVSEMTFRVVSDKDQAPLPDIKVMAQQQSGSDDCVYSWSLGDYTDSNGVARVQVDLWECREADYKFRFSDEQSQYELLDTVIHVGEPDTVDIVLRHI